MFSPLWCAATEELAGEQMKSDPACVNQYYFILDCLAGWINRNQQNVIEYLQEEVKALKAQLGKKPRFNNDQCRRV